MTNHGYDCLSPLSFLVAFIQSLVLKFRVYMSWLLIFKEKKKKN